MSEEEWLEKIKEIAYTLKEENKTPSKSEKSNDELAFEYGQNMANKSMALSSTEYDRDIQFKFIHSIAQLVSNHGREMAKRLEKFLIESEMDINVKFAEYYALAFYYKRYDMVRELDDLTRKYANNFENEPLHLEVKSWIYRRNGNFKEALENDKNMMGKMPNSIVPGYSFALTISGWLSKMQMDNQIEGLSSHQVDWENAKTYAYVARKCYESMFEGKKYGRLYWLYGSLIMCTPGLRNKTLDDAKIIFNTVNRYVNLAMQYEDETEEDYAKRYVDYNKTLNDCNILRMNMKVEELAKNTVNELSTKFEKEIRRSQARELEIVGIFSAVISIIIGGTQIAGTLSLLQGEIMMLFLGGICLMLVSGLMVLTTEEKRQKAALWVLVFAILAMFGLFIYSVYMLK